MRPLRRTALVAFALTVLAATAAAAAETATLPPPIITASGTTDIADPAKPTTIDVSNDTGSQVTVTVFLEQFKNGERSTEQRPVELGSPDGCVSTAKVEARAGAICVIDGGATASVPLTAVAAEIADANSHSARLVIVATSGDGRNAVVRKTIRVAGTKGGHLDTTVVPYTAALRPTRVASAPWKDAGESLGNVPLKEGSAADVQAARGNIVGVVSVKGEHPRPVKVAASKRAPLDGVEFAPLKATKLVHSGEYTGKVDLNGDEEAGEVDVTVVVTDFVGWATGAIGLGILLAFLVTYIGGNRLKLSYLTGRLREAQLNFERTEQANAGHVSSFRLRPAFNAAVADAEAAIAEVSAAGGTDVDTSPPEYAAARAKVTEIEETVTRWAAFPAQLAELRDAAAALETAAAAAQRPPDTPEHPPLEGVIDRFLTATAWATIAEFKTRSEAVATGATAAKTWVTVAARVGPAARRAADFAADRDAAGNWPVDDSKMLDTIRGDLDVINGSLWRLDDPVAIVALKAAMDDADARLDRFDHHRRVNVGFAPETVDGGDGVVVTVAVDGGRTPLEAAQEAVDELVRGRKAMRSLLLTAAFVAAVWAGLVALYFDKPFGTFRDYLAAVLWGLITKGAIDTLTSTVDKIGLAAAAARATKAAA
jgi:hypothetical protein